MAVVKVRSFLTTKSPKAIQEDDLDDHSTEVNTFLATLAAIDVLEVSGEFAPGGKDGIRSTYVTTVVYLGV